VSARRSISSASIVIQVWGIDNKDGKKCRETSGQLGLEQLVDIVLSRRLPCETKPDFLELEQAVENSRLVEI